MAHLSTPEQSTSFRRRFDDALSGARLSFEVIAVITAFVVLAVLLWLMVSKIPFLLA